MKTTMLATVVCAVCASAALASPVPISLLPGEVYVLPSIGLSADGTTPIPGGNTVPATPYTGNWYDPTETNPTLWDFRTQFWADNVNGFQRQANGSQPDLATTITGLDPNTIYRIGVVAWDYFPYGNIVYDYASIGSDPFTNITNSTTPSEVIGSYGGGTGQGNYLNEFYLGTVQGVTSATVNVGSLSFIYTGVCYTPIGTVPEPGTFVLMGMGVLGVAVAKRRARPRQQGAVTS